MEAEESKSSTDHFYVLLLLVPCLCQLAQLCKLLDGPWRTKGSLLTPGSMAQMCGQLLPARGWLPSTPLPLADPQQVLL